MLVKQRDRNFAVVHLSYGACSVLVAGNSDTRGGMYRGEITVQWIGNENIRLSLGLTR
jgi:hypothetical protein